jgi:hypothetical protein
MCDAKNMELQFVCWFDGFETWSDKIEKNRGRQRSYRAILDVVEITNNMHRFTLLLYSKKLAPTCFGSSLPLSGSLWIRLSYMKIQIDLVVYHKMWLSGLCVGVS